MNVLLAAIGSYGDVHPFVGLGVALKRRGHRVTLIASGHFETLAQRAGLEFAPFATADDYHSLIQDPDIWHRLRGFRTIIESGMAPTLRPIYQAIRERYAPGETVVAASSLGFAARVAQEKLGVPVATVHLSPAMFRSDFENPVLPGLFLPDWLPGPLKRAQFWLVDNAMVDRVAGPSLNAFRAELGLPPARGIFRQWYHSPQRVIGMFPDWFARRQQDWPEQTVLTGFPLYDERDLAPHEGEWQTFMNEGSAPIVFTPGSANIHGREFFTAAADACQLLGRRGMLLTRYADQIPPDLPPGVRHFSFAPFSAILPRAAALVHHGGIGTLSQALAAGTPQLIMPLSHDQPDNANRVKRLGVGSSIASRKFGARAAAEALERLLSSKTVAENCRTVAERFRDDRSLDLTCDLIEELAGQSVAT